jgi:hypothetical protein
MAAMRKVKADFFGTRIFAEKWCFAGMLPNLSVCSNTCHLREPGGPPGSASDKPAERAVLREIRPQKARISPRRLCCPAARPHFCAWRLFGFRPGNIQRILLGMKAACGP